MLYCTHTKLYIIVIYTWMRPCSSESTIKSYKSLSTVIYICLILAGLRVFVNSDLYMFNPSWVEGLCQQ